MPEGPSLAVSDPGPTRRRFLKTIATLSIVGYNVPLVLTVDPILENSTWDENLSNQVHRAVRRLVRRVTEPTSRDDR